ncbi:MAG: DKNYY domain-containing protein [Massilia sp.]|nr:DKNYY domain-containing protein [Massilia sp.]
MWRMDTLAPISCKTVIEKSRSLGKDQRYAQIDGHVYWVQERSVHRLIELMEIPGPVAFDRLRSYLSGTYASDGNVLLFGWRRVHVPGLPIDPSTLRRFPKYGTEPSRYVTDGQLILYEDRVLDGADVATFDLIAQPPVQEQSKPEFARDSSSVYYGADRIPGADPGSFRLVDLSHAEEVGMSGYYAVDGTHVWDLFEGIQLVTPKYAEEIRQRLRESPPVTTKPWEIPPELKALGYGLLLLTGYFLVLRLRARLRSRYQASLLSPAVIVLSVPYLLLPSIGYLLLFHRCSEPDAIVIWSLLGSGLAGGAILLGVANCRFMQRADAAITTIVQFGMVTAVLAIGTLPPEFVEGLKSIPAGISRQCSPEHHAHTSHDRTSVAKLRSEIDSA